MAPTPRSLPPLAKKYVLQMLCIDVPLSAKLIEEWVLPDGSSKHTVAIDRLIQLRILIETVDRYTMSFLPWLVCVLLLILALVV